MEIMYTFIPQYHKHHTDHAGLGLEKPAEAQIIRDEHGVPYDKCPAHLRNWDIQGFQDLCVLEAPTCGTCQSRLECATICSC